MSCQRITLHKNLFFSFVCNSVVTIISLTAIANNQELVAANPVSESISGSFVDLYVKNFSDVEGINEACIVDEMLCKARAKCSIIMHPCYVLQQMSNSDLGTSRLRL